MAAAIQSRFDAILRDPQPALCQKLSLNRSRMIVAYLENDYFLENAVFIRKKVFELGGIGVQARIHAGGKYYRGTKGTVGIAAQRRRGVAELRRQFFTLAVDVAVALGHDVQG